MRAIVNAIAEADYRVSVPSVLPVDDSTSEHIGAYIAEYGETLIELPDSTWDTSQAQWMGTHWEVIVDLATRENGRSDLVLHLRVFETQNGFEFAIDSVHVP